MDVAHAGPVAPGAPGTAWDSHSAAEDSAQPSLVHAAVHTGGANDDASDHWTEVSSHPGDSLIGSWVWPKNAVV